MAAASGPILRAEAEGLYLISGTTAPGISAAGFDLDWTLIRPIHGKFPKDASDWAWLPNRISTLRRYRDQGYTLVIFTNQGYKGPKLTMALERVRNVVASLHQEQIYPWVLIATLKNGFRKPNPGMWIIFQRLCPSIVPSASFYVGDAGGRPEDFSDSDARFAGAIGIPYGYPENNFPVNPVTIPSTPTLYIFVGMPGSGKTTWYQTYLMPRGVLHANQDTLKTKAAVKKVVEAGLASGQSVAVDATNPTVGKRREFIQLAIQYRIPTIILYFVRNGDGWNKLRPHPVPAIAYSTYFRNLEEPSLGVDGVPVVEIG